jgi:MFS family permease
MFRPATLIKFLFKSELSEIYISIALRDLALSMAGIFVPIYMLVDLKYPLSNVIIFFIAYSITMMFSCFLAAKFNSRYGVKHGILFSMFGFIAYIILLATMNYHNIYIIPAIIGGLANSFYWVSFHSDFAKFSDDGRRGREVSMWFIMSYLGILFGPIFGAIIITYLGFITLFIIVSLIFLLSALPLFLSSEIYEPVNFSLNYIFKQVSLKETFSYFVYGIRMIVGGVVFPIFIFLILGKYLSLGVIASFAALSSIIIGYFVGMLSMDEKKEKLMLRFGSLFHSLGWFFVLFVKTFIQIAVINVYLAISFIFVDIPHHIMFYTSARKGRNISEYVVYREVVISIGRLFGLLMVLITGKLVIGFILNGVGILLLFFL